MTDERDEREELEIHDDQPQKKPPVTNSTAKPADRSEEYYYGNDD